MAEDSREMIRLAEAIASVEQAQRAASEERHKDRQDMRNMFSELKEEIRHVSSQPSRVNWAGVGVVLSAVLAISAPAALTMSFLAAGQNALVEELREASNAREELRENILDADQRAHATVLGHVRENDTELSAMRERIATLETQTEDARAGVNQIDRRLLVEIEAVQDLLSERIANLDTVLQREMRLLDDGLARELEAMRSRLTDLSGRIRELEMKPLK